MFLKMISKISINQDRSIEDLINEFEKTFITQNNEIKKKKQIIIISDIFYEKQNPNIIVINYTSNDDIFIICYENKKSFIPLQQFSDFFQKK